MAHQRFPEHKRCHLTVRLIVQNVIQRVRKHTLLATAVLILIDVQWQRCDGFRQDTDTGIHCRGLHCCEFIHTLAAGSLTEQEREIVTRVEVFGLISRFDKLG